jgi:hypothetical protein
MNSASEVICDYCQKPIEWQEDFVLGVTWLLGGNPLHVLCMKEVLNTHLFFPKYSSYIRTGSTNTNRRLRQLG